MRDAIAFLMVRKRSFICPAFNSGHKRSWHSPVKSILRGDTQSHCLKISTTPRDLKFPPLAPLVDDITKGYIGGILGELALPCRKCKEHCLFCKVNLRISWVLFPLMTSTCCVFLDNLLPFLGPWGSPSFSTFDVT